METNVYHSPFDGRYTSSEMNQLFSDDTKFSTWRELWIALAKAEQTLGLDITNEQIAEMQQYAYDINYDVANEREREVRHDVMAHVYAFGQQAKSAAGIIHLGATSCYVTDNTDIILMRDALQLIRAKLLGTIKLLADFADEYKDVPTLGYTHYQPATPTTIGKRATLWLQNFVNNLAELDFVTSQLKMLGCRGATGSSETFMKLFEGDEAKCKQLDQLIAEEFGFVEDTDERLVTQEFDPDATVFRAFLKPMYLNPIYAPKVYDVSGQTYPRNLDYQVLNALAAIAASAHKMALDIRLLQHDKEIEEPFAKSQIGSSAMAYKRNPMRSERICSLARYLGGLPVMAWETASTQMLERTLDDSAGRRIYIPDAFRAADAILILCSNITDGIVVNRAVINQRLDAELPFMAVEGMIMRAVEQGANRQEMHAKLREHSLAVSQMIKQDGIPPIEVKARMLAQVFEDPDIPLTLEDVEDLFDPSNLVGRCPGQVTDYLQNVIYPLLVEEDGQITVDTIVTV